MVVTSVMLYACPIWSEALSVGTTRRILSLVHHLSEIRRISGFRIVSDEAVFVLARQCQTHIGGRNEKDIPSQSRVPGTNNNYKSGGTKVFHEQMADTMGEQFKFRLVLDVILWMKNEHCELNYYETQFLTGHGCFIKYLHRFGHDTFPRLPRFRWPGETNL